MEHNNSLNIDFSINTHIEELLAQRFEIDAKRVTDKNRAPLVNEDDIYLSLLLEIANVYEDVDGFSAANFNNFSLEFLTLYLEKSHDYYLNKKIPELEQTLSAIMLSQEFSFELKITLNTLFNKFQTKLISHIDHEDEAFLPLLYDIIYKSRRVDAVELKAFFGDHDDLEISYLNHIKNCIIQQYPEQANDMAFKMFFSQLDSFVCDLSVHGLIEEQVVIPKAISETQKL